MIGAKKGDRMIKLNGLHKHYGPHHVLNDISFHVPRGEVFALLGANGAGKTTAIKILLGLTPADRGTIEVAQDITFGYSPETPYFPPFFTGFEVLVYYARLQGQSRHQADQTAKQLLQSIGLADRSTKVKHYSKGMLQRLALAQALIGDPDVLILDEPTAGLDALGRVEILSLIDRCRDKGKTILLNSHILSDIERVCRRGIILNQGRIVKHWDQTDLTDTSLQELFINSLEETNGNDH